jgi:LmbE family N-acetylglucosaminyl deacetylase
VLPLTFGDAGRPLRRVLALGAHADDIEIGCGGTLLRLLDDAPDLEVWWVVFSAAGDRADEARASAAAFLVGAARRRVVVEAFRDGFFPYQGDRIKERLEEVAAEFSPDIVFTHYRDDRHQDHRLISDLTWNSFRNHLILEYEIPKYDGDLGAPNLFVALSQAVVRRKVDALLTHFPSQRGKHWFAEDLFLALPRLRGMEARAASGYAEGFYCRKAVV